MNTVEAILVRIRAIAPGLKVTAKRHCDPCLSNFTPLRMPPMRT